MELVRFGQAPYRHSTPRYNAMVNTETWKNVLWVSYDNFGLGSERKTHLTVSMTFEHVQFLIKKFAEMGDPDAIKLESAIRLARAAEEAGWKPGNVPQSN